MGIVSGADSIFDYAVSQEKDGGAFYERVAELASDPGIRECFLKLSELEHAHAKTLQTLRDQCFQSPPAANTRVADCLKAMASGRFFGSDNDRALTAGTTLPTEEILKKAIVAEKDSIAFYIGLKAFICNQTGKEMIETIIADELDHIICLNELFEKSIGTDGS